MNANSSRRNAIWLARGMMLGAWIEVAIRQIAGIRSRLSLTHRCVAAMRRAQRADRGRAAPPHRTMPQR